ncbi:MAG TPA: signal peptide peptidase SppA, partial [Savagea sp.]
MNIKRIVAIIAVITLILVSVGVNFFSIVFTKDVSSLMDKIQEETNQNVGTTIVEKGDTQNKIALLSLDGAIQDTGAAGIGLSGAGYNHQFMLEQLKKIKEDDTVKGIVFEVNSPGGGVIES